jgi:hypothetical protein
MGVKLRNKQFPPSATYSQTADPYLYTSNHDFPEYACYQQWKSAELETAMSTEIWNNFAELQPKLIFFFTDLT